jgi:hypothetical protein
MKSSLSLRSAQLQAGATPSARTQGSASAPYLRALLLGGLAVLGSAGAALAQDAPSVKAKQGDAQALYVTVENPALQLVHMKVVSLAKYTSLVDEVNHKPSYGSKLNFSGLPAGKYAVLLRVGRERYRYNVQVQAQPSAPIVVRELSAAKTTDMVASASR